ncbi:MAG: tetratricopeptide repeat protein [Terriglobales bacterium]|jgi:tetratricopeptide (TPR) repeat protein
MAQSELKQRAGEYFRRAYEHQQKGEYEEAIELYSHSIEAFPTAEAYTFRGWAYSYQRNYTQAIADCKKALKIDPEFGNPYNDIGAYLIEQNQWDAAIPWFVKALAAPRYDAYCFPHFNLGRVYEQRRDWGKAREHYSRALQLNPRYGLAYRALRKLQGMWN